MGQAINRLVVLLIGLMILFSSLSSVSAGQKQRPLPPDYHFYVNNKYNYAIAYPTKLLHPQGESDAGDGQQFRSTDGKAELIVYGIYNVLEEKLADLYAKEINEQASDDHPARKVTYKLLKRHMFVVSGYQGNQIFYIKTMLSKDILQTFQINYDQSQKAIYDPVTTEIAKSFESFTD